MEMIEAREPAGVNNEGCVSLSVFALVPELAFASTANLTISCIGFNPEPILSVHFETDTMRAKRTLGNGITRMSPGMYSSQ